MPFSPISSKSDGQHVLFLRWCCKRKTNECQDSDFSHGRAQHAGLRQRWTQGCALHSSHTLHIFDQDVEQERFWINRPREQWAILSCHVCYCPTSVSHASPKSNIANSECSKFGRFGKCGINEIWKSKFVKIVMSEIRTIRKIRKFRVLPANATNTW